MKNSISLLALSLLALAGCGSMSSNDTAATKATTASIDKIKFNLPAQIQWDSVQQGNGAAVIFTPKGVAPNKSPIKFVYQHVKHDKKPVQLAEQILKPLQAQCEKPVMNGFKTLSQYGNQLSYETLCNKFKGSTIGMANYLDVFSDATGSHLLIAEVKTPASAEPGKLDMPKTENEKKVAQDTIVFMKLAQKTMTEVTVCDAAGKCI